jgi:hypothetical protein
VRRFQCRECFAGIYSAPYICAPPPQQLPKFSCQKFCIFFKDLQAVIHSLFNAQPDGGGEVAVKRIISEYFVSGGLFHIRRKRV